MCRSIFRIHWKGAVFIKEYREKKKMKKKILAGILAMTMLFCAGCGTSGAASGDASGNASGDASSDAIVVPDMPEYDALDYVELGDYMGLDIETTQYEATQDQYDEYIDNITSAAAKYETSDATTVKDGNRVDIDYVGKIDGEEFTGGSGTGYQLVIGSNSFIDGFEDQLIGAKVGKETEVDVTFPDDYSNSDVAGKDAVFTVTVNAILNDEKTTPEYNDAFVKDYTNGEYTTTKDYDEYIWKSLKTQAENNTKSELSSNLEDAVYACCTVNGAPDGLHDYYVALYESQDQQMASAYNIDYETFVTNYYGFASMEAYEEELSKQVDETIIPQALVREAILEKENWSVDDDAINSFMEQYASYYGYESADTLLSENGYDDVDAFIEAVGKESFNKAVLSLKLWDEIEAAANITYVPESEASSDATEAN